MARRPFRYTFVLVLVAFGTCLAALSGWRYARVSAPVNGPIVLVSIDALRADRLSPYGYDKTKTPAIAALAADGLTFDRAYSHVPQTLPAHAALLTGRLPFETGVRDGAGQSVASAERLLPEMLRDRGFATGGVVSTFLLRKETGINQGFAFFDADMPRAEGSRLPAVHRDGIESEKIAEHWMDSIGSPRAFLFLHLDEPRGTAPPPDRYALLGAYDAQVAYADEIVGRLVRYLRARQLYEQATIILTADHGEGLGTHGEEGHGLLLGDDTLRVPLIIKPPAGVRGGRRVDNLVQHVDIVPTVLDLAKAPIPGNLRGRSLAPLFEPDGSIAKTAVYSESLFGQAHFGWGALTSVTDGRFRYVNAPHDALYDHDRDPLEHENLADTLPDVAQRLRDTLKGFADSAKARALLAPAHALSEDDRERYERLGYVGRPPGAADPARAEVDPAGMVEFVERYRTATRLLSTSDPGAALDRFRALTRDEPDNADLWMHVAVSAARSDRQDVALEAFKRVMPLAPDFTDAPLGASLAALRLRKFDEARQYAEQALETPKAETAAVASAHELLARIALGRRDPDLARAEATLAEAGNPARPVAGYIEGRIAFDQKRYDEALTFFEPALAMLDKSGGRPLADLRLVTAEAMLAVERFPDAERLFDQELRETPQSTRARTGLTSLYRSTGRRDEATTLSRH